MKTASPAARRRESEKLLTFGFSAFVNRQLFDETKTRKIPVFQGVENSVAARPMASGLITAPRGAELETAYIPAETPLNAPIAAGDIVGTIEIHIDGEIARRTPVAAQADVAEAGLWKRGLDFIKQNYLGHGSGEVFFEW